MKITITKFLASVLAIVLHQSVGQQWVEEVDEHGRPLNMDIYFDRAVMVTNRAKRIICTGVLIDRNRVLTSYTPLRRYVKTSTMGNIGITILNERRRNGTTNTFFSFGHFVEDIECYKRVKDLAESELTYEQWHGFRKEHSPVHDLYILKFKEFGLELQDPNKHYSFDQIGSEHRTRVGPLITVLAQRWDALESGMKFASLGYKDEHHVRNRLRSYEYPYGINAEVDCDEWMIRDWGRFICLKNYENYLGIQAGALLIHKEKLYGIGCFTLKKGNDSIYVFTDIRPYRKEIFHTCGRPPTNNTDIIYKLQIDPDEDKKDVSTTTPRPLLHLGRRLYDDWF